MKTIEELQEMLVKQLNDSLKSIDNLPNASYYNEYLGDASILLTSILEENLIGTEGWGVDKWIDDSLLTKVKIDKEKVSIWGIVIWGRTDLNTQWTSPLYFEIAFNSMWTDFNEITFLFDEENSPGVRYETFCANRSLWDRGFYSNDNWNPSERNWKYVINLKDG